MDVQIIDFPTERKCALFIRINNLLSGASVCACFLKGDGYCQASLNKCHEAENYFLKQVFSRLDHTRHRYIGHRSY